MRPCLIFFFLLSSCVGGSLGNPSEFEQYPLRTASEVESKNLKRCLKQAYAAQEKKKKQTGNLYKKSSEMPVDNECQGFYLHQKRTSKGYEIMAQFHENENTVRWSINQDGIIEEHLDEDIDVDLEF